MAEPEITSPHVVLLNMPCATTLRPSIALGILKSICIDSGVPSTVFYPNLFFADRVGFGPSSHFSRERALYGLSEHLFAVDIFGAESLNSDCFLETFAEIINDDPKASNWDAPFKELTYLKKLRDKEIPAFLVEMEDRVINAKPDVVGFTGTFNQVMSSLALANRLKKRMPNLITIFGGACFDGDMGMEYHRSMTSVIDHIFLGEAEDSFREFLRRLKEGLPLSGIPGVTFSEDKQVVQAVPGAPLYDMNMSPMPNYDDFFTEVDIIRDRSGKIFNIDMLTFESSRGCWWGEKSQCLFCGINRELIPFRAKDADVTLREIVTLSAKYGIHKLSASDWIVPRQHFENLFHQLRELDLDIELFYEVRANLSKENMMLMYEAGVKYVQPGIESLSTNILKLMRKGTTLIKHIQFLRWAKEIGIDVSYNILCGFPGEKIEWYTEMADVIFKLLHLQPPIGNLHHIELHRFSPLFNNQEQFGISNRNIRSDYHFNFPPGEIDPYKIAYFFQYEDSTKLEDDNLKPTFDALDKWIKSHHDQKVPVFKYSIGPGYVNLFDTRQGEGRYLRLADLHHDVFLLCDEVQTYTSLASDLDKRWPNEVQSGVLGDIIDELVNAEVLYREGENLISLPTAQKPRSTSNLREYVLGV